MSLRTVMEARFQTSTDEFTGCAEFALLESGRADRAAYERFLANVLRAHLRAPKMLALLYAMAPPDSSADLLEKLGDNPADGASQRAMLITMVTGAGMEALLPQLELRANEDLRRSIVDPLLYGSLKEVGLATLAKMVAFEYMLSRTAGRIAMALRKHMGLSDEMLAWFSLHAAMDPAQDEKALTNLEQFVSYYDFSADDAESILTMVLRDNVFIRRYFGEAALANASLVTS